MASILPFGFDEQSIKNVSLGTLLTKLTFYGAIPINMPTKLVQNIGNAIIKSDVSESLGIYSHSARGANTIQIFGFLSGPLKDTWKRLLEWYRELQSTFEVGVGGAIQVRNNIIVKPIVGRYTIRIVFPPFISQMVYEPHCVIKSLYFYQSAELLDVYYVIITLESIIFDENIWKISTRNAVAGLRTAVALTTRFNILGLAAIFDPNAPQTSGWSLAADADIDSVEREPGAEVSSDNINSEFFDTSLTWFEFPLNLEAGFPQAIKITLGEGQNAKTYIFRFKMFNAESSVYMQMKVTDSTSVKVFFSSRINKKFEYNLDKYRSSTGIKYRLHIGFTELDVRRTGNAPSGEDSKIVGIIAWDGG